MWVSLIQNSLSVKFIRKEPTPFLISKVKVDTELQNFTIHKLHRLSPHQTLAMITHAKLRSHWCRKCAKNFSSTFHLRRHIRSNHAEFSKEVHKHKTLIFLDFSFLGFKLHTSYISYPAAWRLEEIGGASEGSKFFHQSIISAA